MDGDRVRVRVTSRPTELRRSGAIVSVLTRAHETVVGSFQRQGNRAVVISDDGNSVVQLLDMGKFSPRVNDMAVARITRWPTEGKGAAGILTEVLGPRDKPGVEFQTVVRKYELPKDFSVEAENEAAAFGEAVPESAWKNSKRETFFDRRVFTIDGADAKDFDDAVSIEPLKDGWRLGVHIADVAQYVRPDTTLDKEAYERGTSVYFTGSVIPMLPFPLSDGLCSLRPDVVRLTLSCVMDIHHDGRVGHYRVVESAIKSAKRFTYEQVQDVLNGNTLPGLDPDVAADVRTMGELARLLRRKRFGRGSLDFDFPEPKVSIDAEGRPIDIRPRERLESHKLIEEFMLLANETVARYMGAQPFLYRIHETPDPARIEKLKKALDALGVKMGSISEVLKTTENTPMQAIVHLLVLRSLKQAVYSPQNRGHFGLASECYTHFTSPIRRYPDLTVHRLIKERLHGINRKTYWEDQLTPLTAHCSKRERVAVEAEREFMDIQKTRLMQPHVGKIFDGVVSSVTNFGFFVQLDRYFVEGLVHVTGLGNDYFVFDENRMTLTGRRTGRVFSLGLKVRVRIAAANVLKHQLDFDINFKKPLIS